MEPTTSVRIELPIVFDDEGNGFVHAMSVEAYPAQLDAIFAGATRVKAATFEVTAIGFSVGLPTGVFRYRPDNFAAVIDRLALSLPLAGISAVYAAAAIASALNSLKRRKGQRAGDRSKATMLDTLLADVLVRIARGEKWRSAANAALAEHEANFPDQPDSAALIKRVQRHISRSSI